MSNLLDSDDGDILPASSLGGKVDVACSGMASEAAEREGRPFPGRAVGLGTLDGQPVRETIRFAAVCVGRRFGLSVDVSDWPLWFPPALEFLEIPLTGTVRLACKGFEEEMRGIPRAHVGAGWFCTPIVVLQIANVLGLDGFYVL
jgi:hypothetical protein